MMILGKRRMAPKIVGYSKEEGYILLEVQVAGSIKLWKEPMPDFLRLSLK